MNSCNEFQELISAALAGELEPDDRAALEAHLAACANCRETASAWRSQDAAIQLGFSALRHKVDRLANRVVAELVATEPKTPHGIALRRFALRRAAVLATAAAAGFLVAFVVFGRQDRPTADGSNDRSRTPQVVPVVRLVSATGDVQTQRDDTHDWTIAILGEPLMLGCRLSTPSDVRCEVEIPGAGIVRINQNTDVEIEPNGDVSLLAGQVYCCPSGDGIKVRAGDSRLRCRSGPVQLTREKEGNAVRVAAADTAELDIGDERTRLAACEQMQVHGTAVAATSPLANAALETNWVAALLVQQSAQEEFFRRVDDLCAGLDKLAPSPRYERELRSLGHRCVEPLAAFVRSAESHNSPQRRVAATRILSDLAQPWHVPLLIELVDDADNQVRFAVCSALRRLSGEAVGLAPADNQGAPLMVCRTDREEWSQWWRMYCREHPASTVPSPQLAQRSEVNTYIENHSPRTKP